MNIEARTYISQGRGICVESRCYLPALDKVFMRPVAYEVGDAWSVPDPQCVAAGWPGGVVAATPFGVITVAGSVDDAGRRKIFFSLGRLF